MRRGWIIASADPESGDRELLEEIGVNLGPWHAGDGCFEDCEISEAAMTRLDAEWGRYYWGLEEEETPDSPPA